MTTKVSVGDAGPITLQTLDLLHGEIMLLRGGSETGKTKFIDSLDTALGGKRDITKRVGSASSGFVKITQGEVDEVTVTIGASRTNRSGSSEIRGISGRLDIYDIVEPRQKSALAADKTRTEAFVRLTGVTVSAEMFAPLVGGMERFAKLLPLNAKGAGDDPVGYQRWVKAGLEEAKREAEKAVTAAKSKAATCSQVIGDIDLDAEDDKDVLFDAQEKATRRRDRLQVEAENADESAKRWNAATLALAAAEDQYKGPTVEGAESQRDSVRSELERAGEEVIRVQSLLSKANEADRLAASNAAMHEKFVQHAKDHASTIDAWKKTIDAGSIDGPSDEQIEGANDAVSDAREAVEAGVLVRKAKLSVEERDLANKEATDKQREADELREAAKGTEAILANAVHADGLELRDGRWITNDDGQEKFFADRSRGARASIAIELVCNQVAKMGGTHAVVPYDQGLWQEMDGDARRRLWKRCRKLSEPENFAITIVTAEVDTGKTGPLRWEVYVPEAEETLEPEAT